MKSVEVKDLQPINISMSSFLTHFSSEQTIWVDAMNKIHLEIVRTLLFLIPARIRDCCLGWAEMREGRIRPRKKNQCINYGLTLSIMILIIIKNATYYISQLVRTLWLANLVGHTLLCGPLNLVAMQNARDKINIFNLPRCLGLYCKLRAEFVPLGFIAWALRACYWAINPNGTNSVRNLQYGPRTRLGKGIYIAVFI